MTLSELLCGGGLVCREALLRSLTSHATCGAPETLLRAWFMLGVTRMGVRQLQRETFFASAEVTFCVFLILNP